MSLSLDLQMALYNNLRLKAKVVLGIFGVVLFFQLIAILVVYMDPTIIEIPLSHIIVVPLFITFVIFDEIMIYRYVNQVIEGKKKFKYHWHYIIAIIEITYPSVLLIYGGGLFKDWAGDIDVFMFLNSPPMMIYFLFIILSSLHFDFRLSLISGVLAAVQYVAISYYFLADEPSLMPFAANASKGVFFILSGLMAGIIANKIKHSIEESLESKNILINELDTKVEERTQEIETQKREIETQKDNLQQQNNEIKDSIAYAKRIQEAILPDEDYIKKSFPNSFILYKPKDIVAGDFYWFENIDDTSLIAAADCTGHGVPGAMVSVICNDALNRAVREYKLSDPGLILDKVRTLVIETLDHGDKQVKDGMDIALCAINQKNQKLCYAGAYNPLWIVKDNTFEEIKANKQPIGKFENPQPFTTHSVDLIEGTNYYFFSDGFVDQFGGPKGKKFKSRAFKKLLTEISSFDMEVQGNRINQTFNAWKGELEQIDDVCVIGVKI